MVTRLHHFLIFFPLSLVASVGLGQTVSPLQQVMSTSSLISRPQVFRDMQAKILETVHNNSPGLHLDDFYEEMSAARTRFVRVIHEARFRLIAVQDSIKIVTPKKDTLSIALLSRRDSLRVVEALERLRIQFAVTLGQYLVQHVEEALPKEKKDAIIATLFQVLNSSGISQSNYSGASNGEYLEGIAHIAIDCVFDQVQSNATTMLSAVVARRNDLEGNIRKIDSLLVYSADDLEQRLAIALDRAEYAVNHAIAQASDLLLKGNTGIGISKGTGSFGGGIYLAYTSPHIQFGLYANSQFGKGDTSATASKSLFGLHLQYATDKLQVDFLYSLLNLGSAASNEMGGGISYRMSPAFILGIALFGEGSKLQFSSYGITITPTMNGAPTVFLGLKRVDGSFVMQTSFPIGSSN